MKIFKRVITGICCVAMLLSTVACGGGGEDDIQIPLDINVEASADEKPTLNIHLQATGYSDAQLGTLYAAKKINELTDYNINYSQLPATGDDTALDLVFTNRSKYHAIKVTKEQYNKLVAQDALLNIKPALDKFGADIYEGYYDAAWPIVSKDGGIYGIPEGGSPTKGQVNVVDCIIFRKDLIYSWGKDIPTTREEFTELLQYAKTQQGIANPFVCTNERAIIPTLAVSFDIYQEWTGDNGDYKFYLEHENFDDYLNYMIGINNQGLVHPDSITYDKSDAVKKIGAGDAVAVAVTAYEVDAIMASLVSAGEVSKDAEAEDVLAVVGGFKDSKGEIHTYHVGGYSYVTVIPWYMNEEAGYTIDHINKKIKEENFKRYYIGEENVHYTATTGTDGNIVYKPIEGKFDEVNSSASFCTGTNQKVSGPLWRCRIYNKEYYPFIMELNRNADEEGTYNPMNFTTELPTYDKVRAIVEADALDATLNMIFTHKNISGLAAAKNKWLNEGGAKGKQELANWAKYYWEGQVKVY